MKTNLRLVRIIVFSLILALVAGGIGFLFGSHQLKITADKQSLLRIEKTAPLDKNLDFSLFWTVWDELARSFIDKDKLDAKTMFYGAISGMVASLGDPYTAFLPPAENKQVKEDLNGSFEGVGIELGYRDRQLSVISPLEGTPAFKAGVKAGDYILKIDGKETVGMSLPEAVKLIRGPRGTTVNLNLLHSEGKEPVDIVISREKIVVQSVSLSFVNDVAHLKLLKFGDRTNEEWNRVVSEILQKNPKGVILDVRGNPGGYLAGSVFIASEFLPSGVVVQQESASGAKETFSVDRTGKLISIPLVVLVNEGSASASEIVAGALQEYKRAKIIGEKTFGKGTIQSAEDLPNGSGLHITTARWLLPKGKNIDKTGITPDIIIKDDPKTDADEQLQEAIKNL